MRLAKSIFIVVFISILFSGGGPLLAGDPLPVIVSIPPLKYFVEKIGGDRVDVAIMVEPGDNPHIYEPKPQQMKQLSGTKAYFAIGVDFETKWLDRFREMNADMVIVHTEHGIPKIPMKAHHHEEEAESTHEKDNHDPKEDAHDHGILDPHIWLSPLNAMVIALNIRNGLTKIDPENASFYRTNFQGLNNELYTLNARLKDFFSGRKEKKFMVFHPSWGYFAKAYGLEQIPVEIEGKSPKPKELMHLIDYAKSQNIKVIFAQPQFSSQSAEMVAKSIGGRVVLIDPLAEDWEKNMIHVARQFQEAMQ